MIELTEKIILDTLPTTLSLSTYQTHPKIHPNLFPFFHATKRIPYKDILLPVSLCHATFYVTDHMQT